MICGWMVIPACQDVKGEFRTCMACKEKPLLIFDLRQKHSESLECKKETFTVINHFLRLFLFRNMWKFLCKNLTSSKALKPRFLLCFSAKFRAVLIIFHDNGCFFSPLCSSLQFEVTFFMAPFKIQQHKKLLTVVRLIANVAK